jgi:HK97 family phage portal protein
MPSPFTFRALQRWWPRTQTKAAAPIALYANWSPKLASRSYEGLVRDAYVRNPIAQRAVRLIAEGAATARWTLTVDGVRVADHPLLSVLRRPNPHQGGPAFLETIASHLALSGNAYIERVDGDSDAALDLYVLRPERMTILPGVDGWPAAYRYSVGGKAIDYGVDPLTGRSAILHIKQFHPLDDHYGLGGLDPAAASLETHSAATQWNTSLLQNAARPSGALVYEPAHGVAALSPDQYDRLKAEIEAHFQGAHNAGRPLLLEGGLRWQPLSLSPADMDFAEARNAAARDIALAFGVPPMLLGIPGDNTYANYQEANRALWRLTILPLLTKIANALDRWMLLPGGPQLELNVDQDAIPALASDRERLWQQVAAADFLSPDERRKLLGLGETVSHRDVACAQE